MHVGSSFGYVSNAVSWSDILQKSCRPYTLMGTISWVLPEARLDKGARVSDLPAIMAVSVVRFCSRKRRSLCLRSAAACKGTALLHQKRRE
jgi:hypothetical protein